VANTEHYYLASMAFVASGTSLAQAEFWSQNARRSSGRKMAFKYCNAVTTYVIDHFAARIRCNCPVRFAINSFVCGVTLQRSASEFRRG